MAMTTIDMGWISTDGKRISSEEDIIPEIRRAILAAKGVKEVIVDFTQYFDVTAIVPREHREGVYAVQGQLYDKYPKQLFDFHCVEKEAEDG